MPRWTEKELREAVAGASSLTEVLVGFGLRPAGGNFASLRGWLERWGISVEHFEYGGDRLARFRRPPRPLAELLVEHGDGRRASLKRRLYAEGLKHRRCELCGQSGEWNGERMSLILDHINGVADDNRLENRECALCGEEFFAGTAKQRYCSRACGQRYPRPGQVRMGARRVERPPHEQLLAEIAASSWEAVGRRYGVSGNAVRKWVRVEERARAAARAVSTTDDAQCPDGPHGSHRQVA